MYRVKALQRSYTPALTLSRLFPLKNFCSKNLLTIMVTSRNDYNNNDYNTHIYEKSKLAATSIFK